MIHLGSVFCKDEVCSNSTLSIGIIVIILPSIVFGVIRCYYSRRISRRRELELTNAIEL